MSSVVIFVIIYFLSPIIAHIPMAVISGVLLLVGVAMIKPSRISRYLASRDDRLIFVIVFLSTIILGLKIGIILSLILSLLIYIKNTSTLSYKYSEYKDLSIITLTGNLFYATTDQLRVILMEVNNKPHVLINVNSVGLVDLSCVEQINRISSDKSYGSISILCTNQQKREQLLALNVEPRIFKDFKDATSNF